MPTLHTTTDFEIIRCAKCGVEFGMLKHLETKRREDGADFWCPNGHVLTFGDSWVDQLRRERDRLKQQIAQKDDEIFEVERQRDAAECKTKRVLKRAHAGLCPCCSRTFQDVVRHMKQKHPDVALLEPNKKAG